MKRTFILGDEWLYLKIYCGVKTADIILTDVIKPITNQLLENNMIDEWFFLRYADPKFHLRIRFHLKKTENISNVIKSINEYIKPYFDQFLVWKIQTDTYNREIERYGENTIEQTEQLFYHDSCMIVKMLDMIEGDEGETYRWLFGMRALDALLDDFKFSLLEKKELMYNISEGFNSEFNMNKEAKANVGQKYRKERPLINEAMDKTKDETNEMLPLFEMLKEKSNNIKPIVNEIIELKENNNLQVPLSSLMSSYIHMLCNRLFKSKQRLHELVIYTFLLKYYESEIARAKSKECIIK